MKRSWTISELKQAVSSSTSFRQAISKLGLRPTGGNYDQMKKYVREFDLSTKHFRGQAWNAGLRGIGKPRLALDKILVRDSNFQSFKLKRRLFASKLKSEHCEECRWDKRTSDGYLPLELDHINGDRHDNRLSNLRVLCPNCHSLKSTHRGRKLKRGINEMSPGAGIGRQPTLKMS